jgi:UDP-N-acetylmuramate dehydrogenase
MFIFEQVSLKQYNTFSVDIKTDFFFKCRTETELKRFLKHPKYKNLPLMIIGGGSNLLFTKNFRGVVLKPEFSGIEKFRDTANDVYIKAGAGVVWDKFTEFCAEKNYGGVENLSLIPGTVGAAPIQNIGAYGAEAKDVIHEVHAVEIKTGKEKVFSNADCQFGYRDSIFKNELKGKYIITSVVFRLSKNPIFKLDYGNLKHELETVVNAVIKDVRQAVINIRNSKLPLPEKLPNAGSFFKNPAVTQKKFSELVKKYPELVNYPGEDGKIKLAAGQLIELSGQKGRREGAVGVHTQQCLVIVNYENATGNEILEFSKSVQKTVFDEFGVELEREVIVL